MTTIVLLENHDYVSSCTGNFFRDEYLPNYYSGVNRSGSNQDFSGRSGSSTAASRDTRLKATLQYAYSTCPSGQVRAPKGNCVTISEPLKRNLPAGVGAGGNPAPPQCKRFHPEQRAATCSATSPLESCWWTWQGYKCEKGDVPGPPGNLHQAACAGDLSEYQKLDESCRVWEDIFSQQHPSANCLIRDYCQHPRKSTDCLSLNGQLALKIVNVTTYEANETLTSAAISSGLSATLGVQSSTVTILQIRGWSVNWTAVQALSSSQSGAPGQSRRMAGSASFTKWEDTEPIVDNTTGISLVNFLVSSLPVALIPSSIPGRAATLATRIDTELGSGTVVTSAQFTPWPPSFASSDEVSGTMRKLYEAYEEELRKEKQAQQNQSAQQGQQGQQVQQGPK